MKEEVYAAICVELQDLRAIRQLKQDSPWSRNMNSKCWNSKLQALTTRFEDVSYGTLVSIASQQYQNKMRENHYCHRRPGGRRKYYDRYDAGALASFVALSMGFVRDTMAAQANR